MSDRHDQPLMIAAAELTRHCCNLGVGWMEVLTTRQSRQPALDRSGIDRPVQPG
ncbi:hypothetical protein [Paramesorhizobium deserti]|uniref:hypothetical protein n=1 Tax=Paramesorhizobium deserti TaxID=1494590 RepID=UPI00137B4A2B|nr:hypothetical protein [Paramesorhizobium deserti]